MFHVKHDFFVAKALQAKNMLAQIFICRAQEQREARLRAVRVRNRVGVSLLDYAYSISFLTDSSGIPHFYLKIVDNMKCLS